ncbi:hypothetical protein [Burkholderia sp. NRF60-BP8]|nr:hypothetical protein [Burkholderia sp. NRF60-BP8]
MKPDTAFPPQRFACTPNDEPVDRSTIPNLPFGTADAALMPRAGDPGAV